MNEKGRARLGEPSQETDPFWKAVSLDARDVVLSLRNERDEARAEVERLRGELKSCRVLLFDVEQAWTRAKTQSRDVVEAAEGLFPEEAGIWDSPRFKPLREALDRYREAVE